MTQDDRLDYPDTLDAAAAALRSLDERADGAVRVERLLRTAAELGESDPDKISAFMRAHLIPRCLAEPEEGQSKDLVRSSRFRQLLAQWLDGLQDQLLWAVRRQILIDVVSSVRQRPTLAALYTLATIGYRSQGIVDAFRQVGFRGDKVGHEALRLLIGLAPSPEDLSWVSHRIAETPADARTDEMLSAAARLHDIRWLSMLVDSAIAAQDPWFAFARIAWLGEESPGDESLQDGVWASILKVVARRPDQLGALLFTGGVVRRCNSRNVIPSLTEQLLAMRNPVDVHVRRWSDRVREVVSPRQLSGWQRISGHDVIRLLRPFIALNSGPESVGLTAEGHAKENALETALCSGSADVKALLEVALQHETNPYMSAHVMNTFAAICLPVLPDGVGTILKTFRGANRRENSNVALNLFFAASRLAASSNSVESLTLMLESDGTVDGHPFRAPVSAAVEQATWLARAGVAGVGPLLLRAVATGSTLAQTVAVRSLRQLITHHDFEHEVRRILRDIAADASRQPYVRTEAVDALVAAADTKMQADDCELLLASLLWHEDASLRSSAVSGLLALGRLEEHRDKIEVLARQKDTNGAFILGELAAYEPERYSQTAADLLRVGTDEISHGVLSGFERSAAAGFPNAIVDALISRIRRDESVTAANPPLFFELATFAPRSLLAEEWDRSWSRWMPDSREALAMSLLAAVSREAQLQSRAEELLLQLISDGAFPVRRAAARSLSRLRPVRLEAWCAEAVASGSIKLRVMGAEAARWLESDATDTMDNELLRMALRDPEHVVREAAQESRVSMRNKQWTTELLDAIAVPRTDPTDWVLSSYAAGRAIGLIGDDDDASRLRQMSDDERIPPNVRYWLATVAKEVDKQWRKTTEKWPQASFPWRGALETAEGTLTIDGSKHAVRLSLWLKRRISPDDVSSWGGVATLTDQSPVASLSAVDAASVTVDIAGRPSASVLVVESSGHRLILVGNTPYPERDSTTT